MKSSSPSSISESDNNILTHSPAFLASIAFTIASSVAALFGGHFGLCLGLAGIGALLILARLDLHLPRKKQSSEASEQSAQNKPLTTRRENFLLALLALATIWLNPEHASVWLFALPLLLMFFFDFKSAVSVVSLVCIVGIVMVFRQSNPLHAVELLPNFILFIGASCALVYLRELRQRQLKPLRHTDNLTHAASKQHLDQDLQKEIQRSEREGSDLSLIAMSIDESVLSKLSIKEHDHIQIDVGKLLHNNLRIFDSYYGLEKHHFLIMLPHTGSKQALKIADALRLKTKQEIKINDQEVTCCMGISHLNVGDDSNSLLNRAQIALLGASSNGSNRTLLYREADDDSEQEGNEDLIAEHENTSTAETNDQKNDEIGGKL